MNNELYHHGVKGQQWGVRNGPPYPIEDKVLKKGTRLNSVSKEINSKTYLNNDRWKYTYRPEEEWDRTVYTGPFARYLTLYRGARYVKEHEFETIKDLKMPTKGERVKEFQDLYDDPKFNKIVKNDLSKIQKILVQYKVGNKEEQNRYKNFNPDKISSAKDKQTAYEIFNHAMEAVHASESTKEYAKRISKKYDAMVDDNNQGIYNDTHDPIVIFRSHQVLKEVQDRHKAIQGWFPTTNPDGSMEMTELRGLLSQNEINDNYLKVKAEMNKKGKNVKL